MKPFDIGILGGGQLARMTIMAAQRMGFTCLSLDPGEDTPASQVSPNVVGSLDNVELVAELAKQCRRLTLENEFVPAGVIAAALEAAGEDPDILCPNLGALALIQDKLRQREALARAGVPGPKAVAIDADGLKAVANIGFPMMLKSRFGGYDGKGTRQARTADEFDVHQATWGRGGWLAEEYVNFKRELAVMVFRSPGKTGCFPTMETVQVNQVCDLVFPAEGVDASKVAIAAVEAVGGVGLFGVELFETVDGEIWVNELAPRPHNSGHYTLDWGGVSQFEQHVRLVMDLPVVPPDGRPTCMANLLGQSDNDDFREGIDAALAEDPSVRVHWYGKAQSRVGRKMGHLNVVGQNARSRAETARRRFYAAANPND